MVLTSVGEFWSGQNDSGTGQWPIGTPVLGFGLTYMSLWQLCQGCDPKGLDISGCPSVAKKIRQRRYVSLRKKKHKKLNYIHCYLT